MSRLLWKSGISSNETEQEAGTEAEDLLDFQAGPGEIRKEGKELSPTT